MSASRTLLGFTNPQSTCQQLFRSMKLSQLVIVKIGILLVPKTDLSTGKDRRYFVTNSLLQSLSEFCSLHPASSVNPPERAVDKTPKSSTTLRAASIADRHEALDAEQKERENKWDGNRWKRTDRIVAAIAWKQSVFFQNARKIYGVQTLQSEITFHWCFCKWSNQMDGYKPKDRPKRLQAFFNLFSKWSTGPQNMPGAHLMFFQFWDRRRILKRSVHNIGGIPPLWGLWWRSCSISTEPDIATSRLALVGKG